MNSLAINPPKVYTARLEDKLRLSETFVRYSFELINPHRLDFKAGQYVSLRVSPEGQRRSYSICSTPDNNHQFDLLVDHTPDGLGSQFLQNLEFGAEVEVLAPMGQLVVPDEIEQNLAIKHLVFVATGSGVAPFRSMIEDQLRGKQDQRQITLHWGMRHPEDLFWLDEWQTLAEAFSNFHFHPVLSKANHEWTLCRGHVTDCLGVHKPPTPQTAAYFLCGNQNMIQDVSKLLSEQGVSEELIMFEKFY